MIFIKLLNFDNTLNIYNLEKKKENKKTKRLFKIIKVIYNSKKKYKNLKLQSKSEIINLYFLNFFYLNVILNNITKK